MSYEDLEEARAKRAEKEAAKEAKSKGKRRRKPKNAEPELEGASADTMKRGQKRKRAATEPDTPESANAKMARLSEASQPSMGMIAPVAQMMPQWPSWSKRGNHVADERNTRCGRWGCMRLLLEGRDLLLYSRELVFVAFSVSRN